ncbi:hypothetical protein IWW55_001122 [Coemansia sp. RSA 2706]|nr:hypothetical protein IWW55_001122 [Coemansia sp. RSA 2706]
MARDRPANGTASPSDMETLPSLKRQRTGPHGQASSSNGGADMQIDEPVPLINEVIAIQDVPKWQETTEASFGGIVAIRFTQPIAFDTDPPVCSLATGFIVDAKRGIILTNRHVVGTGPFVGEAVMHDHEVVEVRALYRDPIHDFGFLKFDPRQIKYMKLVEIPLAPEHARVGIDVRIIGNDAGEKLSILAGSISRIDRNVPEYGHMTYNDLNTFYLQSAAALSGGSSGSPVIDIEGRAVALQAGGRSREATNYFFPLDRAKRALKLIQEGRPVLRGSVQTQFTYMPFDVAQKLGLPEEAEAMVRKMRPHDIGMLVVATVLPDGPGASAGLEEGDILLQINSELVTHFVMLEDILDTHIDKTIDITVVRGGKTIEVRAPVQDMHKLTPSRLVTFGGCVVHNLSYQLAYGSTLPPRGVFMTATGNFLPNLDESMGYVIERIADQPVSDIDEFVAVLRSLPDHEPVSVVTYSVSDIHTKENTTVAIAHQWYPISMYTHNNQTGLWDRTKIKRHSRVANFSPTNIRLPVLSDPRAGKAADLTRAMVGVSCSLPLSIEGINKIGIVDYGVIVDAARGLVVASRRTIPLSVCNLALIFGDSLCIPAKLRFLHPTHNFAIIQYDPQRIGTNNIKQATLSSTQPRQGDAAHMITYNRTSNTMCVNTVVSNMWEILVPIQYPPHWRCINTETIQYETKLPSDFRFGLVGNDEGHVQAIWMPFMRSHKSDTVAGLPPRYILPVLEALQRDEEPRLRSLGIEVRPNSLASARAGGLSDSRLDEVQQANPDRNMLFTVARIELMSKAHGVLQELDVIISINGRLMLHIDDLEVQNTCDALELVVLRNGKELTLQVETTEYDRGVDKLVFWCGATFQAPYMALRLQSSKAPSGVHCTFVAAGSPAEQYELASSYWVTQVNGVKTPDLESFERAISECPDSTYARVKVISYDLEPQVLTIKTCYHYWPTSTLTKDPSSDSGWRSSED